MRFYFREAAKNLLRTYQFVLLRIGVGLALALGLVVSVVASIWLVLSFELTVAVPAIAVLFLLLALVSYALGPYLLYLVEAGHVAALTHLIVEGETPTNQIRFGLTRVRANFASVTGLFVLDLAVQRVLRQINAIINRVVSSLTEGLSSGGRQREAGVVQGVVGIVQLALNITIGYVDKAILANVYLSDAENNWKPAKEGVVLYAMTWKPVLASALVVATVFYGPLIVAGYFNEEILDAFGGQEAVIAQVETFLLGLSDVGLLALFVVVLGFLTVFHYGLVKPGLTTLVVTIFLNETVDERPDEAWERRLREHSPEYRAFERRADGEEDPPEKTGTWRDLFLP
jgi:hypothetical protein